jgi:hypothetical protein
VADIEIRAFGLRFFGVLSRTQFLTLVEKQRGPGQEEPTVVGNTAGSFEIADPMDACYQDPYEQETDTELRFGFSG